MITRKQKEDIVGKLKDKLASSNFIAFLNFHGLSVAKAMELRRLLKKVGAEYVVAKKTLLGIAAKETGLEVGQKKLEGEIGMATGGASEEEMLNATKAIFMFAKKNKDALKIIGGFWQRGWIGAEEIKKWAAVPPREVLLTQLAFMLSQPIAGLARAFNAVGDKLKENK